MATLMHATFRLFRLSLLTFIATVRLSHPLNAYGDPKPDSVTLHCSLTYTNCANSGVCGSPIDVEADIVFDERHARIAVPLGLNRSSDWHSASVSANSISWHYSKDRTTATGNADQFVVDGSLSRVSGRFAQTTSYASGSWSINGKCEVAQAKF
jgi:hypothetical protein